MKRAKKLFELSTGAWLSVTLILAAAPIISTFAQQPGTNSSSFRPQPIFTIVEQPPVFPGGNEALQKYLDDNLKFPAEANKKLKKQRVPVKFIINVNGGIDSVRILREGNKLVDSEVVRVIQSMPAWAPGKQNGHIVPVWYNIPVKFP